MSETQSPDSTAGHNDREDLDANLLKVRSLLATDYDIFHLDPLLDLDGVFQIVRNIKHDDTFTVFHEMASGRTYPSVNLAISSDGRWSLNVWQIVHGRSTGHNIVIGHESDGRSVVLISNINGQLMQDVLRDVAQSNKYPASQKETAGQMAQALALPLEYSNIHGEGIKRGFTSRLQLIYNDRKPAIKDVELLETATVPYFNIEEWEREQRNNELDSADFWKRIRLAMRHSSRKPHKNPPYLRIARFLSIGGGIFHKEQYDSGGNNTLRALEDIEFLSQETQAFQAWTDQFKGESDT